MSSLNKSIYFPNLNGIRFIAAFAVIYDHLKFFKTVYNVNHFEFPISSNLGGLGVTLFFTLSGFLITYLLFNEQERFGKINLRFFYMRRVLRIFPLYFLTVILAFFILPHFLSIPNFYQYNINHPSETIPLNYGTDPNYYNKLFLFILFVPNLSYVLFDLVPFGSQLWSLGVEEQFYLFWPALLTIFRTKILPAFLIVFSLIPIFTFAVSTSPALHTVSLFLSYFRIDSMAWGAIMAYVLFKKKTALLNIIFNKFSQLTVILLIILLVIFNPELSIFQHQTYSILFGLFILNMAANPKPVLQLENAALKYLGKISYGLYIFNPVCIVISMQICLSVFPAESLLFNAIFFILSILLTITVLSLSYTFFESRFMKIKPKFSKITSTN